MSSRFTLQRYREQNGFDIEELASDAGVPPEIVYHALLDIPVPEQFAKRILSYLGMFVDIRSFEPSSDAKQTFFIWRMLKNIRLADIAGEAGFSVELARLLDEYNEGTVETFPKFCAALAKLAGDEGLARRVLPCRFVSIPNLNKIVSKKCREVDGV